MKYLRFITLIALLALTSLCSFAKEDYPAKKEKKITAHYNVQATDKLAIDNMYGVVHMNTWDKNEVSVNITITVKAKNDEQAESVMNRISISTDGTESHYIRYKTNIAPIKAKEESANMTIDYEVNMPRTLAIDIVNKYGSVYLGDFEGKMMMAVSYGSLTTKKISGPDKSIKVAYGSGSIASIETGILDISYSNFSIDNGKDLIMKNKFGKLSIDKVNDLKIEQKYGDLDLGTVGSVSGEVGYAGLNIEHLQKGASLDLKYCSRADFRDVAAGVDKIKITAKYSSLYFDLGEKCDMDIDMNVEYGSMSNKSSNRSLELTEKDLSHTAKAYKGKVGKGSGSMMLDVKYGNVSFK